MDKIAILDSNHIVALFTPDENDLRQAASAGMKSWVNFQKTSEKGMSPTQERKVSEIVGLNYLHFPLSGDGLNAEAVDDFRRSLDDLPQPVFLHCASGKRAGAMTLMALAADKGWDGDTALAEGKKRGIDLSDEKIGQFVKSYADQKRQ